MQVFISYSRADLGFAQRLRDWIRALGHHTWFDQDDIPEGAYWPDAIDNGLKASHAVVGVMSPDGVASRNVKNEWDWTLANQKPLLLVRIQQCDPKDVPHRYISLNYVDFAKDESAGFAQLQSALVAPDKAVYKEDIAPASQVPVQATTQNRNRAVMLGKVRSFWVEGVLEKSLHDMSLLELGMEQKPDAVLQHVDYPTYTLPQNAKISTVYDDVGRELLILGAPGSGKTTALLQLARDLIVQADADETQPMPVVFNLSSWAVERKPLGMWLVDELSVRYQIPHKLGKKWVDNGEILPLLDGLDEVKREHRDPCVEAINSFRQEFRFVDMAVCSRISDYEDLTNRLKLRCAIVLQPLTQEQVDQHLARLGDEVSALRTVLQSDTTLQEEAHSPLMLNVMTVAYRGMPANALSGYPSVDTRRKHLFENYVERRLKQGDSKRYTLRQVVHWLSWLAAKMQEQGQTVFYIEGLQASWLKTQSQRWFYIIAVRLAVASFWSVLTGLLLSLVVGTNVGLPLGLTGGLAWVVIGELALSSTGRKIQPVELLHWSWLKAVSELPLRIVIGLVVAVILGIITGEILGFGSERRLLAIAFWILTLGLTSGVVNLFASGIISDEINERITPNQGIEQSAWNGLRLGLAAALLGIPFGLAVRLIDQSLGLAVGLIAALIFGLIFLLFFGGFAVIQHFVLRIMLWRSGNTPINYARFLDYAAERVLLRKVGGGYVFIHRLLLEYFVAS